MYNAVVQDFEKLEHEVHSLTEQLAGYSLAAMRAIKTTLWEGFEDIESTFEERAKLSASLSQSEVTQFILARFKQGS